MTVSSAHAVATAGLMAAADRFAASARRTAAAPLADPVGETAERIAAETAFRAGALVLRTADEMTGRLLDRLA